MKQTGLCLKKTFRFHRWNRAAYSSFMSLGKQISIGRLQVAVSDGLIRDQHIKNLTLAPIRSSVCEDTSGDDDDGLPPMLSDLLHTTTLVSQDEVHPASSSVCNLCCCPIVARAAVGFFMYYRYEKNCKFFHRSSVCL